MVASTVLLAVVLALPTGPSLPLQKPDHAVIDQTVRRLERQEARRAAQVLAVRYVAPTATGPSGYCDLSCIDCESGGDPNAWNPAGYWGLYQYDRSSWAADGGDPDSYGNASAEEQHAVAVNATFDRWPNC